MKLIIDYSDGMFSYRPAFDGCDRETVEVPDTTVAMWNAISKLYHEMQEQICEVDLRASCERGEHYRDNQDHCHNCGIDLGPS